MNPIRYVDCKFQELTLEANQMPFSVLRGGHTTSLTWILQVYSVVIALLFIPVVFAQYLLVLLHLNKKPLPVLELMKAGQDAEKHQMHKKMKKKLGFQSSTKIGVPS